MLTCFIHSFIHSFRPFLQRPFKSSTTQRRSRLQHGHCIGVSRRSAQATAGKGLAKGPYMAARAGVEPTTLQLRVIASTNAAPCPMKCRGIVYHLLRFFAKRQLILNNCPKVDEVLCTYHLKTLMLWTCEDKNPKWWNSSNIIAICCELLHRLLECLTGRFLPNYFIPEANLFQHEANSKVLEKTVIQLNKFQNS